MHDLTLQNGPAFARIAVLYCAARADPGNFARGEAACLESCGDFLYKVTAKRQFSPGWMSTRLQRPGSRSLPVAHPERKCSLPTVLHHSPGVRALSNGRAMSAPPSLGCSLRPRQRRSRQQNKSKAAILGNRMRFFRRMMNPPQRL